MHKGQSTAIAAFYVHHAGTDMRGRGKGLSTITFEVEGLSASKGPKLEYLLHLCGFPSYFDLPSDQIWQLEKPQYSYDLVVIVSDANL